jgi:hypothetical protein
LNREVAQRSTTVELAEAINAAARAHALHVVVKALERLAENGADFQAAADELRLHLREHINRYGFSGEPLTSTDHPRLASLPGDDS